MVTALDPVTLVKLVNGSAIQFPTVTFSRGPKHASYPHIAFLHNSQTGQVHSIKVKVHFYSPDILVYRFSGLNINYPHVLKLTHPQSHLLGENATQFSAAVAIHAVPIFIPPGTHYCWKDRGSVDSKLAQGFYT